MSRNSGWFDRQINKNKLIRRSLVVWAVGLSTFATIVVYLSLESVTAPVATVYGITMGLLGTITKFYFDTRNRDETQETRTTRMVNRREHPLAELPDDWQEILLKRYKDGWSDTEVRAELNITYNRWRQLRQDSPEFDNTVIIGHQLERAWWMRVGRENVFDKNFNSFLWYRNMQNRFGWSDKQTSNVNGPVAGEEEHYDDDDAAERISELLSEVTAH